MYRIVRVVRAADNQLGQRRGGGVGQWDGRNIGCRLFLGKGPVFLELPAGIMHQCATQIEAEVDPRRVLAQVVIAALEVFCRQIATAAPENFAVGDQHLAVVAQIGPPTPGGTEQRDKEDDLDPGGPQTFEFRMAAHVKAHAIDQQAHTHTGTGPLFEAGGNLLAEHITAKKESAYLQRLSCAHDDAPHGGERLLAIFMDLQAFVGLRRWQPHHLAKLLCPCRRRLLRSAWSEGQVSLHHPLRHDLSRSESKIKRQGDIGNQQNAQHPGNGRRRVAALVQGVRCADINDQADRHQQDVKNFPIAVDQFLEHRQSPDKRKRYFCPMIADPSARGKTA